VWIACTVAGISFIDGRLRWLRERQARILIVEDEPRLGSSSASTSSAKAIGRGW
jgi:hypothetical protein